MIHGYKVVALCTSRVFESENQQYVSYLNQLLSKRGFSLWIYHINADLYWDNDNAHAETAVYDLIDYRITDAVILMDERIKSKTISRKIIDRAKSHDVPVVVVDAEYDDCACVRYDYTAGFEKVVRHIIEAHHVRRPHMMAGLRNNIFSDERIAIFKKVIAENGIPFDDSMISYGDFWANPTIAATRKLLERDTLPEAIICANDIMAINVSTVLQQNGIAVPEQVIVSGFDGIDEINFTVPRLTSAQCNGREMARKVMNAVLTCIEDPSFRGRFTVEPSLILNESCGCKSNSDESKLYSFNDRFYRYQDDDQRLFELIGWMHACKNLGAVVKRMDNEWIQDLGVVLNNWCTDFTRNHFEGEKKDDFGETMLVLYDTDDRAPEPYEIQRSQIIPNLEKFIKRGFPLIFDSIGFVNVTLGYICFHFRDSELLSYRKIPQIVNTISAGLGGFMSWQYQRHLMEQIEFMYKYDSLTGLNNRLSFNREFAEMTKQHDNAPLTVILADLDGLKYINDNFGHNAGDNAIRCVAGALKHSCPEDALCVRFGGDEMLAVICGECDPRQVKQHISKMLNEYNSVSGLEYTVGASVGYVTSVLTPHTDLELLIREADEAMYTEKQAKKRRR